MLERNTENAPHKAGLVKFTFPCRILTAGVPNPCYDRHRPLLNLLLQADNEKLEDGGIVLPGKMMALTLELDMPLRQGSMLQAQSWFTNFAPQEARRRPTELKFVKDKLLDGDDRP